jgi:hypothetical protein
MPADSSTPSIVIWRPEMIHWLKHVAALSVVASWPHAAAATTRNL